MQAVSRSGQPELIGSVIERQSLPTSDRSCEQLEIFNARMLKKPAYCDPGDSKDTRGGSRRASGTASAAGG